MPLIDIRRIHTSVEDIFHEGGPPAATPLRRGAIAAVLTNPYAGRYEPDILPLMEALNSVGLDSYLRVEVLRVCRAFPATESMREFGQLLQFKLAPTA